MIEMRDLAVLLTLLLVRVRTEDDCKTETPEFSYVSGLPSLTTRSDQTGVRALNISWTLSQVFCRELYQLKILVPGPLRAALC